MLEALRGLTLRGRALLAAGLTCGVASLLLGLPVLVRFGAVAAALPVITVVLVGRTRYRLGLTRRVSPEIVPAGTPATVSLTVTNDARLSTSVLLLEDQVSYVLGPRPRFTVTGAGRAWRREVSYQVRSDVRGRHVVGPMTVRVCDPLGLVRLGRTFTSTAPLVVTPRVRPLAPHPVGGASAGSGNQRPRSFTSGSAEDVTVRDYRRGDDLRRVHWPSSARTGELMVRREEQPWQQRATVLVDNRAGVHAGRGAASSLEVAVTTAASVAVHLAQRGFAVRLVTARGEEDGIAWHDHVAGTDTRALLEALAVLPTESGSRMATGWLTQPGHDGLVVAVLGALPGEDTGLLRRVRAAAGAGLAVVLDVGTFGPVPPEAATGPEAASLLTAQGWTATTQQAGEPVEQVWDRLAAPGARSARATSAPTASSTAGTTTGGPA
ncbi:DUF58 domain-containing protein [Nocardioides bruguierae]|uniref:DUF58 domain-containing protein n=1 Tax=Nocardioides bruguierae TaxID=2945102 RepID=UPI002022008F|nr:DUF58 domain-containing protein [Nocardioides bruguierae]MCL8026999.1 DUF58 domain-containing protein [Nocardioides bruguierae]